MAMQLALNRGKGNVLSYDFMTLAPEDFEALSADLLSKEWGGGPLEIFKSGMDGGVDLRHSRTLPGQSTVIVQCKRYAADRFAALARNLSKELPKLNRLRPERYVVVTSVPLSPHQKDKLVQTVSPWCHGPHDIYGCAELNELLRRHPGVVAAHFKLWISGTQVLRQVLHADVFALSNANLDAARDVISRLVVHDGVNDALEVLEQRRHLLILGNPGIGKSTLARMMMSRYVAAGYEAVWTTTVRDAWRVLGEPRDEGRKLFLVLDDFLGRVRFNESKLQRDEDRSLFALLDAVGRSSQLRVVLTTREYILEDAKRASGLFGERSRDLKMYTLLLKQYSEVHRARMVFNHLYFSDLPDSRLEAFVASRAYRTIVSHRHFSPRMVEFISKAANSQSLTDEDFLKYVTKEFDNPTDLWRHPFENEISPLARLILSVLWTFDGRSTVQELQSACARLQSSTVEEERQLEFEKAVRQLDGNFLQIDRLESWNADSGLQVSFQNPSVEEFVEQRLGSNPGVLRVLVGAILSFRQISTLLDYLETHAPSGLQAGLPEVYAALRERAYEVINPRADDFLSSPQASSGSTPWWSFERSGPAERVRALLKLDKAAASNTENSAAVRESLKDRTYWAGMMEHVHWSHYAASAIRRLADWICNYSAWPDEEVVSCMEAMRLAFGQLIVREDSNRIEINTVQELIDGFWTVAEEWPSSNERRALDGVLARIVESLTQGTAGPDDIQSERYSLELVETMLGLKYAAEMEKLEQHELDLRGQEGQDAVEAKEASSVQTEKAANMRSIDELFASLAER